MEERARGYRRRALELGSNLRRFESRSGSAPLKRKCKDMSHRISLFLCFFAVRLIFPLPIYHLQRFLHVYLRFIEPLSCVVFPIHFEPPSCWTNGTLLWYDLITGSVCYIFTSGGSGHGDIGVVHLSWAQIFAGSNPVSDPLR